MAKNQLSFRLRENRHPFLYEVNTRILLPELSRESGSPVTLGSIPDKVLDRWAELGFDAVWMMGVWGASGAGRAAALTDTSLDEEYRRALPDFSPDDVLGSPYAVQSFEVPTESGGPKGLARLRKRITAGGWS